MRVMEGPWGNVRTLARTQYIPHAQLALYLGVSLSTVNGWMVGKRADMNVSELLALVDLFDCRPEDIVPELGTYATSNGGTDVPQEGSK